MRKLWKSIRTAMAWEVDVWNSNDRVLTMHNPVTGKWRHRKTMASSGSLWISPWVEGKPRAPMRPEPPSGGSGVRPKGFDGLREAMQRVDKQGRFLEAGMKLEQPRRRPRIALTPAPHGGFIVGEEDKTFGGSIFKNLFAGDLQACLKFMESYASREITPC